MTHIFTIFSPLHCVESSTLGRRNNSTNQAALTHADLYSYDTNSDKILAASFLTHSRLTMLANHAMPSKQAFLATIMFSFDLILDLVLSFIGYCAFVYVLQLPVGIIASNFFQPSWTSHQTATFSNWRNDMMTWTVLSLWAVRFVLRWRKHLACPWKSLASILQIVLQWRRYLACPWRYIASILRWLYPLSPKPIEACLWCTTGMHGELAHVDELQDERVVEQRGVGSFLCVDYNIGKHYSELVDIVDSGNNEKDQNRS